jgi:hypothetical protein
LIPFSESLPYTHELDRRRCPKLRTRTRAHALASRRVQCVLSFINRWNTKVVWFIDEHIT